MTTRLIAGAGGVAIFVSLFLPWAGETNGWELWTVEDVYLLIVAMLALATCVTGGRIGLFRPDVSLEGAADILSVVAGVLLVWLLAFDFPEGADRGAGAWLALAAAWTVACSVGDWSVLRGTPVFAKLGPRPQPPASVPISSEVNSPL